MMSSSTPITTPKLPSFKEDSQFSIESLQSTKHSFKHIPIANVLSQVENGNFIITELCKIFQARSFALVKMTFDDILGET